MIIKTRYLGHTDLDTCFFAAACVYKGIYFNHVFAGVFGSPVVNHRQAALALASIISEDLWISDVVDERETYYIWKAIDPKA